ncbi:T9SS type A sorting domain-containing protein [Tenacibaculum holothuriorum]|uniref:T9SS type A sorting domain-containing protein n=1 Tax=Tenacibaculum holothuriorum TaxID=1635173 RepID=UPI000A31EA96|nr:T9SS type A sorting domain-containing protein [Tenacibaculum holothuriorum]
MKKNYFFTLLLTLVISSVSLGQTLINENFDYGASAGDLTAVSSDVWSSHSGTTAVAYSTTSLSMASYPSSGVGGSAVIDPSKSQDVNRTFTAVSSGNLYAGALVKVTAVGSGNYFMHFRTTSGSFFGRLYAKKSASDKVLFGIREGGGDTVYGTTEYDLDTTYLVVLKYDFTAGAASVYVLSAVANTEPGTPEATVDNGSNASDLNQIAFRQSSNIPNAVIDGIRVATTWNDIMTQSTNPSISITAPTNNTEYAPNVTQAVVKMSVENFNLSADNGSGDSDGSGAGYIKQTLVTGGNTTVQKAFTANDVTIDMVAGQSYTATVELVDNSGNSLSPEKKATVTFSRAAYTQVANLAALRAADEDKYYEVTGQVVLTYNTGNSRNQRYIQDATAGILIDDPDNVITTTYNPGDAGTGLRGKLSSFSGTKQFIPTEDPGTPDATGQSFTTTTVSLEDLKANINDYESEWVKIEVATFDDADGTKAFEAGKNYNISNNGETMVFRTNFSGADFIGNVIPSGTHMITGIAGRFNSTVQIYATEAAGIVLGTEENTIKNFGVFPNPVTGDNVTIRTSLQENLDVKIYNILGRNVLSTKLTPNNKTVNVSGLNTGIYLLKVVENGKTATKKLVIR